MVQRLPLHNRARHDLFTLVDDEDYERLGHWRWRLNSKNYAIRGYVVAGKEVVVGLHREIMQPPAGYVVDHVNHDRLLNVRSNLRVLTPEENAANRRRFKNNSSGFKGITFLHGKWHAHVEKDGRDLHLGFFEDIRTAALAYDFTVTLLYGTGIAWLNFPGTPIPDDLAQTVIRRLEKLLSQVRL